MTTPDAVPPADAADAAEQAQAVAPDPPGSEPDGPAGLPREPGPALPLEADAALPLEADSADAAEQAVEVPIDEDEAPS